MTRFRIEILRTLVEEGVARHGLRGYARKLDLDVGILRSLCDGRDIQSSKLLTILDALGLGLGLVDPAENAIAESGGFAEPSTMNTNAPPPREALRSGYLPIPVHAADGMFGATAPVAFARAWLEQRQLKPETLTCVAAPDDVMAPAIAKGAVCLIDGSLRRVSDHAVWAYLENGQLRLSNLSQPDRGTLLISGNGPHQPPRVLIGPQLDAVRPLGRVVWSGGPVA